MKLSEGFATLIGRGTSQEALERQKMVRQRYLLDAQAQNSNLLNQAMAQANMGMGRGTGIFGGVGESILSQESFLRYQESVIAQRNIELHGNLAFAYVVPQIMAIREELLSELMTRGGEVR